MAKPLAMISQPMNGLTDEQIQNVRSKAIEYLNYIGYDVLDTFFKKQSPKECDEAIYMLSKSIKSMSMCDCVYFCEGWENARGCKIENEIASAYGLEIIYE